MVRPKVNMATLNPVRGTQDILPDEHRLFARVEETARDVASRYGYGEISTPIFEFSDVFSRTLGETSDIVTKEMYSFEKGDDRLTLRPEGTAGVARAVMSNGLRQHLPLKFFYRGPMFRYERPQKGRRRQFHQVGVELLGVGEPLGDVEVIALGHHVLSDLGLADKVTLEINSLGDSASRHAYREKLVAYLSRFLGDLSEDSKVRLEKNPLRILDSKDEGDRRIVVDAPLLGDSLNDASRKFFDTVLAGLASLGIAAKVNPRLVRGLDYYSHTAFEFTTDMLGAQGTVLAGGRYDGLFEMMGGPTTPGIGWAAGIERLTMLIGDAEGPPRPIAIVPLGAASEAEALKIAQALRHARLDVDLGYVGSMKSRMKRADKVNAIATVIIGDNELAKGVAAVRDMDSGQQTDVSLAELERHLARYRASNRT
jgi:histidyl-tRNA synthetase